MAKTLLTIAGFFISAIIAFPIIITRRSDRQADMKNNEETDEMSWRRQICPQCKTGKESYMLDEHSESCPYVGCWENGKCQFFKPLNKPTKTELFK